MFLVNDAYCNTFASVYAIARNRSDFIVEVAAVNSVEKPWSPLVDKHDVSQVLTSHGIEHQFGFSAQQIEDFCPDWIFVSRPYDDYAEDFMLSKDLARHGRLCHLSYGTNLNKWEGEYAYLASNPWIQNATVIFVNSPYEFQNDSKFVAVGQFKVDEYTNSERKICPATKPTIAWKPRWTASRSSSLSDYLDTFTQIANSGIEVRFVQHPLMLRELELSGNYDLKKRLFDFLDNDCVLSVVGADFLDQVLGADILVADTSSTLAEFCWTGKPIIWTNPELDQLNLCGLMIHEGVYECESPNHLLNLVKVLLDDREDVGFSKRQGIYASCFGQGNRLAAKNVISWLLRST